MPIERVVLEVDNRPALNATNAANKAMDAYEQGAVRAGRTVITINDRTRASIERLPAAAERQAAAYGKSPVERLVAQRDLLIQRLGNEQSAIQRTTAAYEKMIEVERRAASA